MSNRNQTTIIYIIAIVIVGLGILLGTLFDLDIAKALSFEQIGANTYILSGHWFFNVFNVVGTWIVSLFVCICCIIIAVNVLRKIELKSPAVLLPLVLFLANIAILAYSSAYTMKKFAGSLDFWHYLVAIIMTIVISSLIFLTIVSVPRNKLMSYMYASISSLVCIAVLFIIVMAIKFVFGRMSPVDLIRIGDVEGKYRAWHSVSPSFKYTSFPSLTIALLTFMFSLTIFFNGKKEKNIGFYVYNILAIVLLIMFALSALFSGENYLTDISFAFGFGFLFSELNKLLFKKMTK